jgi:hypothetical protein
MNKSYRNKSIVELLFIIKDAGEAARCAQDLGDPKAESKYLDQVNDASDKVARRAGNYYLQTQAPAGNWVDYLGSSDLNGLRLHAAHSFARGDKVRIVERHDVVVK